MASAEPAPGEGPVLASLAALGYETRSLADLRHSGTRYQDAIPVLVEALDGACDTKTLTEVVRALSVPWAKPVAIPALIRLFRRVEDPTGTGLRWTIGNALDVTWDDTHFEELVSLARDRSYGRAREMVVLGLGRSRRPEAGRVLVELLEDSEVNGHAVEALGKLRVPYARDALERMTSDSRAWVRRAATRALAKLRS